MSRLSVGEAAPEFALRAHDGTRISLADLVGQRFVLYFYPKDDSPGCSTEACDFRDRDQDFSAAGARILGVSPDPIVKHEKFREKYGLPFTLLSDPEHTVADAYGVWVEKKMYGRTYMGIERSTFIIDAEGRIEEAHYKVRPKGHAAAVLERVQAT